MMKKFAFLMLLMFPLITMAGAQDLILKKNGVKIRCKITQVDSTVIHYQIPGTTISDFTINRDEVATYVYGKKAATPGADIDRFSLGLGFGLDFGGFGTNLILYPQKNIGLFGGVGYALAGVGLNGGLKIRIIPSKASTRLDPFIIGMYGYNTAIYVVNEFRLNKLFYGPSFGVGLDFQSLTGRKGYWTLALLVPIRRPEVKSYIDELKFSYGVEFKNSLFPVAFSAGYRFIIQ